MALNILVVNPPYPGKREIVFMPLGLGYVISITEKQGHRVKVVDMHNLRLPMRILEKELRKDEYDLCFMGGFAMQVQGMREVARLVRELSPRTTVVIGGVGVSDIPEIALDYTGASAVAIGECEAVLPDMLASIEAGAPFEHVPTFVYKKNGNFVKNPKGPVQVDLDELPFPAFHHFDIEYICKRSYNGEGSRSIHMMTSRGCPFRCSFCINSVLNDNDFLKQLHGSIVDERNNAAQRFRSPANIVKEIDFLRRNYGISDFHFADEEFITHKSRLFEVCDAIRPLGITWSTSGRADWATEEKLHAMRTAGCRYVLFGVETGSQKMMDLMHKNAKKEKVILGLNSARKVGMNFIANFMFAHPGETEETIRETVEFCKKMDLVYLPTFTTLFPNSKMFHEYASEKVKDWSSYFGTLAHIDFTNRPFINLTNIDDQKLVKLRNRVIAETFAYKLVGLKRSRLAKILRPILSTCLVVMDASPDWLRWFIRGIIRQLLDFRPMPSSATQIPPNELGQGFKALAESETEDGYQVSLDLLQIDSPTSRISKPGSRK
ncbi:MAG: radical SAM protein [Candidatus Tectomicrobia bacterium]|uniref:Radical SAM protein n=1 Tax=Tectimicrobiota bacterium TaxID=2528274 RepID=A0A932HX18_UNCTE|nr:radical SAM protein [Candidatus Tectomicrobia bacterium]